uniref:Viral enhancing factor homolog n=1 Tax=Xestia c-nigrum granulosis virus TaxID=51677 RepID=P89291_GVXN|nr:viral enhancing factor homolog [Xestia c-nigrum granulovirus]
MYLEENKVYDIFLRMVMQCSADLLAYFYLISLDFPLFVNVEDNIYARAYPFSAAYHKSTVYPMKFLISDYDTVTNSYDLKLFLDSNLSLVSIDDLVQAKIVQEKVTVRCVIDDPTQIIDEMYSLYDGNKLIRQGSVTDDLKIEFTQLYRGVYTLRPPRGLDKRYKIKLDTKYTHLIVDGTEKEHTLVYTSSQHERSLLSHRSHTFSAKRLLRHFLYRLCTEKNCYTRVSRRSRSRQS